jgi:hypothetical protein
MQTINHTFLNSQGSLNHTLVENTARDVRTEVIRSFFSSINKKLSVFVSRLGSGADQIVHAG